MIPARINRHNSVADPEQQHAEGKVTVQHGQKRIVPLGSWPYNSRSENKGARSIETPITRFHAAPRANNQPGFKDMLSPVSY